MTVHELPIVLDVIDVVKDEAEKKKVKKVKSITLVVGELSSVIDESVQMYFELLAENTVCENAKLFFEHVPAMLKCTKCGFEFPHQRNFDCPSCGHDSVLIKGTGRELYVKSINYE